MRNLAIIPARSGSKGLKDKNIKLLKGKPLIWYSIQAARDSVCFDEIMVSTDSQYYANVAIDCGASVPFLRSVETSSDTAGSWDVVQEVLFKYKEKGLEFDSICLLQPTSPLRKSEDIIKAYRQLKTYNCDSITSVCEVDHSPLWCMTLPEDNSLEDFRKKLKDTPRQGLPQHYRINGAIYIRLIEYVDGMISIKSDDERAYIMDKTRSVDIDTQEDFDFAEWCLSL